MRNNAHILIKSCLKQQNKHNKIFQEVYSISNCRSSCPEVFLKKGVLKICSKVPGEPPCRSVISIATLLKSHFGMGVLM